MSRQIHSFALVLLVALSGGAFHPHSLRAEEAEPMSGLEVELWWAGNRSTPVEGLMLSSQDRADATEAWKEERGRVMLGDIPGLEELTGDEFGPRHRHIAILNGVECRTLYDALETQRASDWKRHPGYDAVILYDGNLTRRNLGTPEETCTFLRQISARMQPQTAAAIAWFADAVDATPALGK